MPENVENGVFEQLFEQRTADAATTTLGQNARCDVAAAHVRPIGEAAPGELAVELFFPADEATRHALQGR